MKTLKVMLSVFGALAVLLCGSAPVPVERVGACSWSWGLPIREVVARMEGNGIRGVNLALMPFIGNDRYHGGSETPETWRWLKDKVAKGDLVVMSTMISTVGEDYTTLETIRRTGGIVPDEHWAANRERFRRGAEMTKELNCRYLLTHAGFMDESDPAASAKYLERVTWIRDVCATNGVTLILETGQETADALRDFLRRVPGVCINFDPANMILYAKGRPMEEIGKLSPWIRQVHVKDACRTSKPGTWGTEVPWGAGEVGGRDFIAELERLGFRGNYVIERESGTDRVRDIVHAKNALTDASAWAPAPCPGSGSWMMTEWGGRVTPGNVLREYPRPQLERGNWTCLNGLWDYAVTKLPKDILRTRNAPPTQPDGRILVPFAIESPLSGVGRLTEPDELIWYRRTFRAAPRAGERTLLNFEGVDMRAQVFVNGAEATDVPHEGMLPFSLDITDLVRAGENELVVEVWDPSDRSLFATGKQDKHPNGCMYTRSSGIIGTVWLETVPETHITGYTVKTDAAAGTVAVTLRGAGNLSGAEGRVEVLDGERVLAQGEVKAWNRPVTLALPRPLRIWSPGQPNLYALRLTLKDGDADAKDVVKGYFGLRTVEKRRDANGTWRFFVNGEPTFLMGPLDQGWWPDGFLTPPSEEAMAFDIRTLKSLGFNMMRKHIKVEPRRYYYLCDTLGIMVIQDQPCGWGDTNCRYANYRRELAGMIDLLENVPSIVMWCPYNEGWGQPCYLQTRQTFAWTRRRDPSRLVNGPSGWEDLEGGCVRLPKPKKGEKVEPIPEFVPPADYVPMADTIDMHKYRGPDMFPANPWRISFLGEFGGLGHAVSNHVWRTDKSWGYGGTGDTATREGLETAYLGLMTRLEDLASRGLSGSVYTQTTDVELEINGYLTYDRKVLKFDRAKIAAAHAKVIEKARRSAGK